MNGPQHYKEAQSNLDFLVDREVDTQHAIAYLTKAQVHATLALVSLLFDTTQHIPMSSRPDWKKVMGR